MLGGLPRFVLGEPGKDWELHRDQHLAPCCGRNPRRKPIGGKIQKEKVEERRRCTSLARELEAIARHGTESCKGFEVSKNQTFPCLLPSVSLLVCAK